ncbi:hypothetical protein NA78x_005973 [Anatilimnocola sp. NA78]|uniref:hypothetical protein n=1 Tax=Anatilimnocola sp. NA78 TaxID=3415683 RepID=UPI003CE558F0
MTTLTSSVKGISWDSNRESPASESIATETPNVHPAWEKCIDALLAALWSQTEDHEFVTPSDDAIKAALSALVELKKQYPFAPPTFIGPEPDGGIIVERRVIGENDDSLISQFVFFNDGRVELTAFCNGEVTYSSSIK